MAPRCKGTTLVGNRCKAAPSKGSEFCFRHAPRDTSIIVNDESSVEDEEDNMHGSETEGQSSTELGEHEVAQQEGPPSLEDRALVDSVERLLVTSDIPEQPSNSPKSIQESTNLSAGILPPLLPETMTAEATESPYEHVASQALKDVEQPQSQKLSSQKMLREEEDSPNRSRRKRNRTASPSSNKDMREPTVHSLPEHEKESTTQSLRDEVIVEDDLAKRQQFETDLIQKGIEMATHILKEQHEKDLTKLRDDSEKKLSDLRALQSLREESNIASAVSRAKMKWKTTYEQQREQDKKCLEAKHAAEIDHVKSEAKRAANQSESHIKYLKDRIFETGNEFDADKVEMLETAEDKLVKAVEREQTFAKQQREQLQLQHDNDMAKEYNQHKEESQRLQADISLLTDSLQRLQELQARSEKTAQTRNNDLQTLTVACRGYEKQIEELRSSLEECHKNLGQAKIEHDNQQNIEIQQKNHLDRLMGDLEQKDYEIRRMEAEAALTSVGNERATSLQEELMAHEITQVAATLRNEKSVLKEMDGKVALCKDELTSTRKHLRETQASLDTAQSQIRITKGQQQAEESKIHAMDKKLLDLQSKVREAETRKTELDDLIRVTNASLEVLRTGERSLEIKVATTEKQLQKMVETARSWWKTIRSDTMTFVSGLQGGDAATRLSILQRAQEGAQRVDQRMETLE